MEMYKTIKRSISQTTSGLVQNGASVFGGSFNSSRLSNASHADGPKAWIHPPDSLVNGKVTYSVKMLGRKEVPEPKGSHVVRDAIHAIRFQLQVSRGETGHSGAKLQRVDIQICVDGLSVLDSKTRKVLFKHPISHISFSADDKEDKRVFSYIAKTDGGKHECFVFLSDKLAEKITMTIGQAFDLGYQRYIDDNKRDLENQKKSILLRKRVVELELENNRLKQENSHLKQELAAAYRLQSSAGDASNGSTPPVPNTPIPPAPSIPSTTGSDSPVFPIVPPPNRHPRRSNGTPNKSIEQGDASLNAIFARERDGPDVGTKLQNLQLDKLEDVFDDEFDPRAHEKPKKESKAAEAGTSGDQQQTKEVIVDPTIAEFEAMLKRVDQRLAEMGNGFQAGSLATGDTGDTCRDLESEEIYHTPKPSASSK